MSFTNTLGRTGTARRADFPPGQRDPAPENVPCRVDIAICHQTAAAADKLAHTQWHFLPVPAGMAVRACVLGTDPHDFATGALSLQVSCCTSRPHCCSAIGRTSVGAASCSRPGGLRLRSGRDISRCLPKSRGARCAPASLCVPTRGLETSPFAAGRRTLLRTRQGTLLPLEFTPIQADGRHRLAVRHDRSFLDAEIDADRFA